MPVVSVYNQNREIVGSVELPNAIYDAKIKPQLVQEVVRAHLNTRRAGTACTKTRGEVSYSTRKLFRQKKTGRARRGSRRSPLLRKGGVVFGPKPRDYGFRPPAKVRRGALISVLTDTLLKKRLLILDHIYLEEIRTQAFLEIVTTLDLPKPKYVTEVKQELKPGKYLTKYVADGVPKAGASFKPVKVLFVIPEADSTVQLSARNLPNVKVQHVEGLNCYDILAHDHLVILKDSLKAIEERLLKK
jgi:large subunit ribosomal protein L4